MLYMARKILLTQIIYNTKNNIQDLNLFFIVGWDMLCTLFVGIDHIYMILLFVLYPNWTSPDHTTYLLHNVCLTATVPQALCFANLTIPNPPLPRTLLSLKSSSPQSTQKASSLSAESRRMLRRPLRRLWDVADNDDVTFSCSIMYLQYKKTTNHRYNVE